MSMDHIDHLIGKEVQVLDHPDVQKQLRGLIGTLLPRCDHPTHLFFLGGSSLNIPDMVWYHIEVLDPPSWHGPGTIYREDVIIQMDNKGNDLEDWLE